MRFKDRDKDEIDWEHIFESIRSPKVTPDGETYIDVTEAELRAIDQLATICRICRTDYAGLPVEEVKRRDEIFKNWHKKAFAYLEPK